MAYMEVLLREDIDNLGHRGEVVRVRTGYGRNYLIPQGLAIQATSGSKRMIEEERRILAKREAHEHTSAQDQASRLSGVELVFDRRVGEQGILFGSVTANDIVQALDAKGHKVERRRVMLQEPIKRVGEYDITIKLHRQITPAVKVVVRKEGADEVAPEAEAHEAVASAPAEGEAAPTEQTE
jgi:large subunit ribosomal protein L9